AVSIGLCVAVPDQSGDSPPRRRSGACTRMAGIRDSGRRDDSNHICRLTLGAAQRIGADLRMRQPAIHAAISVSRVPRSSELRAVPDLTISPEFRFHALGIAYLPSARAQSLVEGQGTLAEPLFL